MIIWRRFTLERPSMVVEHAFVDGGIGSLCGGVDLQTGEHSANFVDDDGRYTECRDIIGETTTC